QCVAIGAQAHGVSEQIGGICVRSLDVRLLRPSGAGPRKDVNRAGAELRVVVLVAVDTLRATVFSNGANSKSVAVGAQPNRETELVAIAELISDSGFTGVRGFDIRLLRPSAAGPREDVNGSGLRDGVIVLVAVNAFSRAALPHGRNRECVPVLAQGHNKSKLVALSRIGGFDICLLAPHVV